MICGAQANTTAAPDRTMQAASATSRSTRSRARSMSPRARAFATTGKVTVHSMRESTMGNCATFCA